VEVGILLNLLAFAVTLFLAHIVVTIGWLTAHKVVLTRRLIGKAIIPKSEGADLSLRMILAATMSLGPIAFFLLVAWWIPGGLDWVARSWGVKAGILVGFLEFGLFAFTSSGRAMSYAAVYKAYADKFPKRPSAWQEKELAPYRKAHADEEESETATPATAPVQAAGAGSAVFQGGAEGFDPPARIDFSILETHPNVELTETAPYFKPGATWSAFKCRTSSEPPATFWFAEKSGPLSGDPPFAFGDSKMWSATPEDGANLCRAIVRTFHPSLSEYTVEAPSGVMTLSTAVFSRSTSPMPNGGFSGKGSWTATKWFTEDGSEFFFNWSASAGQGHFSEKDELYAEGICEAFGARFERQDQDDEEDEGGA
jgi:hypothetical protein